MAPKGQKGRNGKANVTQGEIQQMHNLKAQGVTLHEIARRVGRSPSTVAKHVYGKSNTWYMAEAENLHTPPPKQWDELSAEAKEALEDFRVFRNRYFKRDVPPFQQDVCDAITKLDPGQALVALWPPGFGKTTLISHDYVLWRMLRARSRNERFACLLISKTANMSRSFLRRLRVTMERNRELLDAYGWMKPENPDRWTEEQLRVDGFDLELQGKEATFMAAGMDSQIYGWRVELIVCDDLVDKSNASSVETTEKLRAKFHEEVESRLEKSASLAVCGTRFSMNDLYGQLVNLKDEETGEPMYQVVQFAAHDLSKCPGREGPHEAYPDGCHLWPEQKSYAWLMRERQKMGSARFDFVYNQVESSDDENLFRSEWVEAAKDETRSMWHIPSGCHLMATLDPSPTRYACAQVWAFDPSDDKRYLVAVDRRRMTVGDMIALMEDWHKVLRDRGYFPTWIFEENAAQRWLFQSLDFKLLRQRTNINVRNHTTHRNKVDPQYGVQSLAPLYEYGKVSLPWGDPASRKALAFFIGELKSYPNGTTDDGVMAQWFFEWNIRRVTHTQTQAFNTPPYMPAFLKSSRKLIAIR